MTRIPTTSPLPSFPSIVTMAEISALLILHAISVASSSASARINKLLSSPSCVTHHHHHHHRDGHHSIVGWTPSSAYSSAFIYSSVISSSNRVRYYGDYHQRKFYDRIQLAMVDGNSNVDDTSSSSSNTYDAIDDESDYVDRGLRFAGVARCVCIISIVI